MHFKVLAHAEGMARPDKPPPDFAPVIPKGFFATRYVSATDAEDAKRRVRDMLGQEVATFDFWSSCDITIQTVERVSFIDHALNARKRGASWYAQ